MKLLNENASLDKINAYLDKQKDSGTFYHHIREMIIYFAPNGGRLRLQDHELID